MKVLIAIIGAAIIEVAVTGFYIFYTLGEL